MLLFAIFLDVIYVETFLGLDLVRTLLFMVLFTMSDESSASPKALMAVFGCLISFVFQQQVVFSLNKFPVELG